MRPIRLLLSNLDDPDITEGWLSEPNEGLNGRTSFVAAGNTLGGTSAINGGQFSRPEAKVLLPCLPTFAPVLLAMLCPRPASERKARMDLSARCCNI